LAGANVNVSAILNANLVEGAFAGVVARYAGPGDSNMYWAGVVRTSAEAKELRLLRNVNGVWTVLGKAAAGLYGDNNVTLRTEGDLIQVKSGDQVVISVRDSSLLAAGQVGARASLGSLKQYAAAHIGAIPVNPFPWRNAVNHLDVNNDGRVTALDALSLINELNRNGAHALDPNITTPPTWYWDVNGDNRITALDALTVINYINN